MWKNIREENPLCLPEFEELDVLTREEELTTCDDVVWVKFCSRVIEDTASDDDVVNDDVSSRLSFFVETVERCLLDTVVIVLVEGAVNWDEVWRVLISSEIFVLEDLCEERIPSRDP